MRREYGVIFDMDGVLVDSYRPHYESWRLMARERGLELTEEQFASLFGCTSREIIARIWQRDFSDDEVRAFDMRKEQIYRDLIRADLCACDGLTELLAALGADGAKLAVGSSGPPENVDLVLDGLGIRSHFTAIVTGMDVHRGKPDPAVFLLAAKRLSLEATRCIVVEDAPPGLLAARRAGAKAIGITTSHPASHLTDADLIVTSLRELDPARIRTLIA